MPTDKGHAAALVAIVAAVAGACTSPDPLPRDAAGRVSSVERRSQFREHLRGELGDRYDLPLPAATAEQIERGGDLYDALCRACHGPTGSGAGRSARHLAIKPPDLTDPETAAFFSDRAKLRIVEGGIEGTPMIGWRNMLQEEERLAVLYFMNTLIREPAP